MRKIELGSPIRANLEITGSCPLACKHCYTSWGYAATGKRIVATDEEYDMHHFDRIVEKLVECGIHILTITGGEPFEKKGILFSVAKKAKKNKMKVFVNTSAVLINESDIEIIKSLKLDGFLISLMSCKEDINNKLSQTNSYSRTVQGIKMLVSAGQNVSINMVCSKENYKDIKETAQYVQVLGVNSFSAAPMMAALPYLEYLDMRLSCDELKETIKSLAWVRDNLPIYTTTLESLPYCAFSQQEREDYRSILSHSYCCAGMNDCAVSVNGDIRPCIMSSDIAGNILIDSWKSIWNNMSIWRTQNILPDECRKCVIVGECGGGCRVSAKTVNGSYDAKDPYMKECIKEPLEKINITNQNQTITIKGDSILSVSKDVVGRKEPFGGTVFYRNRCLFLKKDPYELFLDLQKRQTFTINDVRIEHNLNADDLTNLVKVLTEEGVFCTIEETD